VTVAVGLVGSVNMRLATIGMESGRRRGIGQRGAGRLQPLRSLLLSVVHICTDSALFYSTTVGTWYRHPLLMDGSLSTTRA